MSARAARRTALALGISVAVAVGCATPPPPEYDPAEAAQAGIYPSERRWEITTGREIVQPLGALARWRPPAPVAMAGLGIVVGLRRTGDTGLAAQQLLDYWHQQVGAGAMGHVEAPERPGSAALVAVEGLMPADGPPGPGEVRLIGNATSLEGGRLLTTALRAGTEVLATAEGPLILSRVAADGSVTRDPTKARAPQVVARRSPDASRLEFDLQDGLPGSAAAVLDALRAALPGARVWLDKGPPARAFATLTSPMGRDAVDVLLATPLRVPVGEPGVVVVYGGEGVPERVELLGPPPALGLVSLRLQHPRADNPDAYVRLVGVPQYRGRSYRRALVEFDAPDGRRVRVVAPNTLQELLPVLDRVGLSLRDVAFYLDQAHDGGALPASVVVRWEGARNIDVPGDQGGSAGGR